MYNTASHIRWMASWMVSRFERKNTSPFFKYTDYKSWVASHFHPFRRKTLQLRLLDIQNMKLQMIQCDPQILLFDMRQWACPLLNECEKKRSFYFHSKKKRAIGFPNRSSLWHMPEISSNRSLWSEHVSWWKMSVIYRDGNCSFQYIHPKDSPYVFDTVVSSKELFRWSW